MRKDVVLRWATTFLGAVALAVVVALFVLEPIVGLFALAGIAVGSATGSCGPGKVPLGLRRGRLAHRDPLGGSWRS
jgi:hypothetical protein